MAFARQDNVTITGRGAINLSLHIPDPDDPDDIQYGRADVALHLSNGTSKIASYDLLLRLQDNPEGQGYSLNLADLRDYIIARVESEVLPLP